ncbi:MAG TPA: hypothetical protein VH539_20445 [Gemmatimonadaceae bacterium]
MNTLLDAPAEVASDLPPSRRPTLCAACERPIKPFNVLCIDCGAKAPPVLVRAYHSALNAVRTEGQPERVLEVAIERLVAGVRGEPLPDAPYTPLQSSAPPAPAELPRSILPPSDDDDMKTRTITSTCNGCKREFEFPYVGGRLRRWCDDCNAKDKAAKPAKEKREEVRIAGEQSSASATDGSGAISLRGCARGHSGGPRCTRGTAEEAGRSARGARRVRGGGMNQCSGAGGRGCACPFHVRLRERHRGYARARRAKRLDEEMQTAATCPRRQGSSTCGGRIRVDVVEFGKTKLTCERCERRTRGICRDCPARVYGQVGKAIRCARCARVATREAVRASEARHHDERIEKSRAYYRDNEEVRRRRNEYKRAWRKANPEKVRAQKKRYVDRHAANPNSRYNRYHKKYRTRYREQKRELERDRLQAVAAPRTARPCTRCGKSTRWRPVHKGHAGKPWTVCTKCLHPCERKTRLRNRRRALARAKAWLDSIPDPSRIRRPPTAAVRGPGWERTCITPGCDTVLTHRKKKCTKCRQRDAQAANQTLAHQRGRGRRTDLEGAVA